MRNLKNVKVALIGIFFFYHQLCGQDLGPSFNFKYGDLRVWEGPNYSRTS